MGNKLKKGEIMKKLALVLVILALLIMPAYATDRVRVYSGAYEMDVNSDGSLPSTLTGGTITTKTDSAVAGIETDTVVWTPTSGKSIVLTGIAFTSDTATTLLVESSTTAVIPTAECTASGLVVIGNGSPLWKGSSDATLTYTVGTSGRHSILMYGYEVD